MSFASYSTAALMRDTMESVSREVLQRERPQYRYATVQSVDIPKRRALVNFSGEPVPVPVRYGALRPKAGALVRVDGLVGDRHIVDILDGDYEFAEGGSDPNLGDHVSSSDPHSQYVKRAGDSMSGALSLTSSSYNNHLRIERGGAGPDLVELTTSGDNGGSLRFLIDGTIASYISDGQANFNGVITHNMPMIVRRRTTSLTVSNNSHTLLSYNVVDGSQGASFGSSQNVFTIPQTGIYVVTVNAAFGGVSSTEGYTQCSVTLNSTSVTASSLVLVAGAAKTGIQNNGGASGQISGSSPPLFLNAGNTLRAFIFQRTGGDLAISTRNDIPTIAIVRIG